MPKPVAYLESIIHWGVAATRLFQVACSLPRILTMEPPILPPPPVLREDRKVFIASLVSGSSELATFMSLSLCSDDIDFQQCFLESLTSKGMHRWLAAHGCKLPTRVPAVLP